MWSKKYSECQNCGAQKYKHKNRGYCNRCYTLILEREKVEKWKYDEPDSWIEIYRNFGYKPKEKEFDKIKIDKLKIYECRLNWYRYREETLKGTIKGIDIENGLRNIANLCGVKDKGLFRDMANTFDWNFEVGQKKIIFECIDKIEQNIPWRVIDSINCLGK